MKQKIKLALEESRKLLEYLKEYQENKYCNACNTKTGNCSIHIGNKS